MTEAIDDNQKGIIKKAVQDFVDAQLQDKEPDIDEFAKQYPGLEHQIKQSIKDMQKINTLFDSLVQADESDFEDTTAGQNLIGKKVDCFEITEVIGSGGMGVVYLARDTRLDRLVAIKSISVKQTESSVARMRFKREAKLLASLNHPNIAVIHDIIEQDDGDDYLILEYVPGETLTERISREPLTVEQALSIGRQIARAVSAAHKKGIVHRDLKPGNIKITPDGQVKVLDFGLAKATVSESKGSQTTATQPGRLLGTPAYMSPEQARGKDTDHRTDIWSFGCIMYQMLTGHLPFEGETATDTLAGIIEREPDWQLLPKETPANICKLLHRCLEKDPGKRLDNIADVTLQISDTLSKPLTAHVPDASSKLKKAAMIVGAVAIVALSVIGVWVVLDKQIQPPSREIRLVVLPFDNLGPAAEEWFADGMTDEITTHLAGIHGLAVISRQSAIEFKKMGISTQLAKEFNLDYFLEGTVQCDRPSDRNSQVRIRIQLIKTADDTHVWQETYDNDMSNIFSLQTDIAEKVAQALDITLLEPERKALTYGYIDNTEAYACYVHGHRYLNLGTKEGTAKAIELYEKAIELEPNYAQAHASLSNAFTNMYWRYGRNREHLSRAKIEADRAIKLAPDLSGARIALGRYYYQGYFDYENALTQFEIARQSNPNHTGVLYWTGAALRRQGKFEQALLDLLRAVELDPLDRRYSHIIAATLVYLRRYEEAERYFEQAIGMAPDRPVSYCDKAWLYLTWQGDTKKARKVVDEALLYIKESASNQHIFYVLFTADLYDREYEKALERIRESQGFINIARFVPNSLWLAEVYGYMGMKDLKKQNYLVAAAILEKKVAEDPNDHRYHSSLGKAYAGLGREQEAIEHGRLGVECLPVTTDAYLGPLRLEDQARIYAMLGKCSEAIDILELLLNMPSEMTTYYLQLDPVWDPLRNHPRFKKLIEQDK